MLLAEIQARSELDPDYNIGGDAFGIILIPYVLIPCQLAAG
jgi:hypothetical protein